MRDFFKTYFYEKISLFFLLITFLSPLPIIYYSHTLIDIDNYEEKFNFLTLADASLDTISLPFSDINTNKKRSFITGSIVPGEALKEKSSLYIFIPAWSGEIAISVNGLVFYNSSEDNHKISPTSYAHILKKIPIPSAGNELQIEITLGYGAGSFGALSEVYIGSREQFNSAEDSLKFYYEDLRIAFLGANFLFLATLLLLLINRGLGTEGYPPLIISMGLLLMNPKFQHLFVNDVSSVRPYIFASLPLCLFAISDFRKFLLCSERYSFSWKDFRRSLTVVILILASATFTHVDIKLVNTYFTAPLLTIGVFFQSFLTIRDSINLKSLLSLSFSCALLPFSVCLSHDVLVKFGYHNHFVSTTLIEFPLLWFVVCACFASRIVAGKNLLRDHNIILLDKLEESKKLLSLEFQKTSKILAEGAFAKGVATLNTELHDGIMTYLSMINALTEEATDQKTRLVNRISRNASTEIRVIIDAEAGRSLSLFAALGTFRERVVAPFELLGVKINWDITEIYNYHSCEPREVMEIVRIFQEAFTNAVERAKCSEISVLAEILPSNRLKMTILNSGGLEFSSSYKPGIGIKSMENRAASIDADFSICSEPSGAKIEIVMADRSA